MLKYDLINGGIKIKKGSLLPIHSFLILTNEAHTRWREVSFGSQRVNESVHWLFVLQFKIHKNNNMLMLCLWIGSVPGTGSESWYLSLRLKIWIWQMRKIYIYMGWWRFWWWTQSNMVYSAIYHERALLVRIRIDIKWTRPILWDIVLLFRGIACKRCISHVLFGKRQSRDTKQKRSL